MKIQGDFNSVNLGTGEKTREIVGDGERRLETVGPSQFEEPLQERIQIAFYEAEQHRPAKDGHCAKCGFCHCEVGHVLAMARQNVLEVIADERQSRNHTGTVCFTCDGENGQPATRNVSICEQCFGEELAEPGAEKLAGEQKCICKEDSKNPACPKCFPNAPPTESRREAYIRGYNAGVRDRKKERK